jgi:hypothetical protein
MIRVIVKDNQPNKPTPKQRRKGQKKGKSDYEKYLQSDQWHRRTAQERSINSRCSLCNRASRPLNVHHRTYERVGNERPGDLIVLCDECHGMFHRHYVYASHSNCFVKK